MQKRAAKLLVVDDDPCLRELLKLHLVGAGYEVQLAQDAIEAGYAILKAPPELLIVDVNMPFMNGIDLVATLVADATIPTFPFMFLSSDETRMEHGYALGASAYLLKPVVKDRLLEAVARAVRRAPAEIFAYTRAAAANGHGERRRAERRRVAAS